MRPLAEQSGTGTLRSRHAGMASDLRAGVVPNGDANENGRDVGTSVDEPRSSISRETTMTVASLVRGDARSPESFRPEARTPTQSR